ncbi:hypothetical protein [Pseudomonas sp. S09G 359]|jgi:hypothetical protein|uniref:hypothetical protein n=1 Tax=Pseudomonas sp. S09G 359 TaxID=2054919 RepID=UPI000C6E28A6|nr:hypothetical protein [Pseudomonas sp. S09G 359]AUG08511.1 hypothetical protein CXQ82_18710 [Pseudomonas sp. S09G 359]
MDMENGAPRLLKRYRYLILLLMVAASLVSATVRFVGDWRNFWTVLMLQAWFGQAVFAYLLGGWVAIGPGGLAKDASPTWRAVLAGFAFAVYLVGFGINGYPKKDSAYDRRPSDWTMPIREEIGRSSEKTR